MNAKYNYLKNYMKSTKTNEDKYIDSALEFLSQFWEELPERTKGVERRDTWALLIYELKTAFDKQIEKIANCPYVKIEISEQPEIKNMLLALRTYADIDSITKNDKVEIGAEKL